MDTLVDIFVKFKSKSKSTPLEFPKGNLDLEFNTQTSLKIELLYLMSMFITYHKSISTVHHGDVNAVTTEMLLMSRAIAARAGSLARGQSAV